MKSEEDSDSFSAGDENVEAQIDKDREEQALLLLIEHRTKEVERNTSRVWHFANEVEQSEKKLEEVKTQLSRFRGEHNIMSSKKTKGDVVTNAKVEQRLASPTYVCPDSSQNSAMSSKNSQGDVKHEQRSSCNTFFQIRKGSFREKTSRPQIILPAVNTIPFQPVTAHEGTKTSNGSNIRPIVSVPSYTNSILEPIGEKPRKISSELEAVETQAKGTKRKFEQKEQKDLIPLIGSSSSARTVHCQTYFFISSQHKRRLRSLVLCPTNDQLFVTSALDGIVNLWQVQARGSSANFLSSSDCASVKQRRWPEDIAWHPHGNSLFSVYSADGGDSQVAVLDLNKAKERSHVNFLEDKPHVKGIINNIMFMPWEDTYFVTGGSDHAVVLWTEKDGDKWKPKALHRNLHSSAVMGVAGLQHKHIVISAGADKRISGFDVLAGKADYMHQIESKCMSIIPNPFDLNLFMVQTGTPRRQLRLFDYRLRQTEIHAFGWEQESSQSQSALINQAWSPDGLYITSGSADPVIHIFDIRYNSQQPTQSIRAHQNRVFKAVWHHALPLLISISSDLNIGLHKIT